MQEVTVNTQQLMAEIRKNRALHADAYFKASEGYRQAVQDALSAAARYLKKGTFGPAEVLAPLRKLEAPKSYLADYDRALSMLAMSVDPQVTLQAHEFQQLVLDEWGWKQEFVRSTSMYAAR